MLGRDIGVGEESEAGIDTGRDAGRGQEFAIFDPARTFLPPDVRD